MTDLLLDIGNSRIKWALAEAGELGAAGAADDVEELLDHDWPELHRAALAATGHEAMADRLQQVLASRWPGMSCRLAVTESRHGRLQNSYQNPSRMGVDRWLAMIAVERLTAGQPFCVIDVGTAVTVDLVNADGRHVGGWIAPGLTLMRRALAMETARVGGDLTPAESFWGQSTGAAVHAGTLQTLNGLAARAVTLAQADLGDPQVHLTGGDAPLVQEVVESLAASVRIDPLLVLRGLEHWLDAGTRQ